jgi:hypothetical protein
MDPRTSILDLLRQDPAGYSRERERNDNTSVGPHADMKVGAPEVLKYGALEAPTVDLEHRPRVKNADGTVSTVRSMGVNLDGKEVLIPTVSEDARIMGDDEAIEAYRKSGRHLGVYPDPETSDRAAEKIHQDQAKMTDRKSVIQRLSGLFGETH